MFYILFTVEIIIIIRAIFIQGNLVNTVSIVINKGPVWNDPPIAIDDRKIFHPPLLFQPPRFIGFLGSFQPPPVYLGLKSTSNHAHDKIPMVKRGRALLIAMIPLLAFYNFQLIKYEFGVYYVNSRLPCQHSFWKEDHCLRCMLTSLHIQTYLKGTSYSFVLRIVFVLSYYFGEEECA